MQLIGQKEHTVRGWTAKGVTLVLALGIIGDPRSAAVSTEDTSLETERRKVDALVAKANSVELRKISPLIFQLAERLLKERGDGEARPYFEKGLEGNSWALPEQLTLGELLARNGQPQALQQKAEMVLRVGEEEDVLRRASRLLGRALPAEPPAFSTIKETVPVLCLTPVGNANLFALGDLRESLSKRLGIAVQIVSLNVKIPAADRSMRANWIAKTRERILATVKEKPFARIEIERAGFTLEKIQTSDEALVAFLLKMTEAEQGTEAAKALDEMLARDAGAMQWDASVILGAVQSAVADRVGPRLLVLGVTPLDLHGGTSNYLFGIAATGRFVGVASLHRFRAAFNNEPPKRERLTERLLKQSLSTIGHMLGVPRCTTPECARAYPESLVEHDQKPSTLCPECRAGVEKALGQKLPAE
jgi:predicted Zn-dependent protease